MDGQPLVLVVEQNLHNLEILNSHLKVLNFSCICAKQGVRALILAQTHQPDLILLDIMLPDLSGLQVIHYLKRNPETKRIPIIGVTTLTREQNGNSVFLAGADDCITKPYNLNQLEVVIQRHLCRLQPYN